MKHTRPNILLILTDQQRADCLGIEGHPVLQTPNLDWLARAGTWFRRGYAECPSCIPARRVLTSGQAPFVNGMVGYREGVEWNPAHTLAGELARAGYQTEMVGKLHLWPERKRFGFDHMWLSDAPFYATANDYLEWLRGQGIPIDELQFAHGVSANGWVGRPDVLPEEKSHTYWCVSKAIEFLRTRDPSAPFFLNLSFFAPHPPLTPPRFHYDRYLARELPAPVVGDWAPRMDQPEKGLHVDAWNVCLDEQTMRCCRAAYYGLINHIDDQIGRLFNWMKRKRLFDHTFLLFTSDHGEMLGDHHLFRKTFAYEASARVPFLACAPPAWAYPRGLTNLAPVGHQDIMPTLLAAAGVPVPKTVTGRSLLPWMRGEEPAWRDVLHGEHAGCYEYDHGMHYLTDGHYKYVWYSQTGREHLFHLDEDPNEMHDLASKDDAHRLLAPWRRRLIGALKDRPERFTDGTRLIAGRPHRELVPAQTGAGKRRRKTRAQ